MYRIIIENIELILRNVDVELDIRTYLSLVSSAPNADVTKDFGFQHKYCRYWRLFGAGLCQSFRTVYFEHMERLKSISSPDVGELIRILYQVPSNKKGRKTLQFSFATKLLHTLDPHRPIYDSMVATFYRFTAPSLSGSLESRLQNFLSFYGFLTTEYKKVLSANSLERPISIFRNKFSVSDEYSNEKIVDTLIWRAMDLKKKSIL